MSPIILYESAQLYRLLFSCPSCKGEVIDNSYFQINQESKG